MSGKKSEKPALGSELSQAPVVRNFRTTDADGKHNLTRHYRDTFFLVGCEERFRSRTVANFAIVQGGADFGLSPKEPSI